LRQPVFRAFWIANVVSLVGAWAHDVAAAWLMTSLAPSPFMVAMVQTATTLPFCILALPAGALADILNKRRLLLITQAFMLIGSAVLGVMTIWGLTTPAILLAFTFLLGFGGALNLPVWQAVIPELVPREELPSAITLNSVGFNLARVAGPAIGGFVAGAVGPGVAFLLRSVSYAGIIGVVRRWKSEAKEKTLPEERLVGAIKNGIRYVKNAPEVKAVLVHVGLFTVFGCSLWAFLPIVAREYLGLSALGYGALFGLFGIGGVCAAVILPRLQNAFSLNVLVAANTIIYAAVVTVLGYVHSIPLVACAVFLGGMAWLILLSILNTAIQAVIPSWVRGRVLSVYLLVFFGGLAGGSALWGMVAHTIGIPATMAITALGLVAQMAVSYRHSLSRGEHLDLRPSDHWPSAGVADEPELDEGPVLIIVEYRIDPARAEEFGDAIRELREVRLRGGAIHWNLFRGLAEPGTYVESFVTVSWAEHRRQHERWTVSDREAQRRVAEFQLGEDRPRAKHFIAEPIRKR
jgi:MFS family permease